MGKGFSILTWDDWGSGMVRINARLVSHGEDIYGNPVNWFPYRSNQEREDKINMYTIGLPHYKIIE